MTMGVAVDFHDDGRALLTWRSGENRFNLDSLKELNEALDEVESNPSCRVLITTGEGKFYSNGLDLPRLRKMSPTEVVEFNREWMKFYWRLMHFPLVTVAAINGHAFGGGGFMAICHDYRVMRSNRGWISWNEILISLQIGEPLTEILDTKLTKQAIRESVVYAKRITGPEAMKLDIVDRTVEQDKLIETAKALGFNALGKNKIERNSLQVMKQCMYPRRVLQSKV